MTYKLTRTCKDCENVDSFELTKKQAAFELYNSDEIWNTPCSKCGSKKCSALGQRIPDIDIELLDIWGYDQDLFFMEQDEDLILAEYDYFPMVLKAIDEGKYLKSKIEILIEASCVLLYDNTVSPEEYSNKENLEREKIAQLVRPELIKRKRRIIEAGDAVRDYIKKIVYSQLGIN